MANRQNMIRAARSPPRAKCLVRRAVSSKEESAGLKWTRQERERDAIKEGEGLEQDLLQVAPDREAGGSHLQATAEEERIVEWTRELREIRRMVELLQRRDRKLHVKADVAVRRLERLEKKLPAGGRRARSLPVSLADRTKVAKLVVDKWFADEKLRLLQHPDRRDRLHPRQRCPRCRSPHDRR